MDVSVNPSSSLAPQSCLLMLSVPFVPPCSVPWFWFLSLHPPAPTTATPPHTLSTSTCFAGTWQVGILSSLASLSLHLLERRAKRGWGIGSLWRKVFGGRSWIMFTRHKLLTVWTWHVVNEIYFHDDYFYTPTIREPTAQHRRGKRSIFLPFDTPRVTF